MHIPASAYGHFPHSINDNSAGMIKVIIVEDEVNARHLLKQMLNDIDENINVVADCPDLPCAIDSIKFYDPKIVFLDVNLPEKSGMQLYDFLDIDKVNFKVIFTTASSEYAVEAFNINALDYILKPIQYDKLRSAIEKYYRIKKNPDTQLSYLIKDNVNDLAYKKLVVPISNGFDIVNLNEILFIKAEGSYTKIFIENGRSILISYYLKHFEDILSEEKNFIRIHRGHIINIHFIKKIIRKNGTIVQMQNDTELPITTDKIEAILNSFNFRKSDWR